MKSNKKDIKSSPLGELERGRNVASQCGDCNTCGKCDEANVTESFDAAVRAAASIDRDSYEKNLARQRQILLV